MSYQKVYMNQVHSSTLLSQLAQMWKSQLLCDAIIKTGTVTTKAHRLVLVAACPMLQSMENASVGSHLEVRLAAEIKQDSVNTFLQYLYEGFMMLTEENVRDVEKVARLLQVESIITCCSDFDKCLRAKNGSLPPNAPYKYNFADLVEFRHVRTTDLQKTVQERMIKRAAEMSRPSSPGNKRQRMHKPSSDSHSDSYIGANRTDDSLSMSQSYMSGGGGSGGGSQWDRVPRIGTSRPGRDSHHMPGVIDIVDDSIELVQTEPPEKGGGKIDSKSVQKSVSVSISSQISATDVQVVNVTDSDTSSKPSVTPTPSSSSSRGSITVSPLTIFDSPAGRDTSTNKSQDSKKDESRQTDTGQSQRSDSYSSQRSDSHIPQRSDNHQSQRSPFPISLSSVQGSGQSKQFGPSGGQAKPFAAGSATQASYSHSSPVSSAPSTSSPASHSMNRNENLERASPAEKSKSNLKHKEPPESSTADMTPDLSIVKIESRNAEIDTGGLDMYVDMPEHGVMQLHRRSDDDQGEHSDIEYEEPSGDWSREDMSNEGSNISGDQNNSWYVGTFKGLMGMEHARSTAWNSQVESYDQNIESEDGKAKVPWEIRLFKGWLSTVHLPVDFENYSASDLNDVLSQFYVDGKNRRGEPYSVGTLFDVRKGIMGYLCGVSRHWEENVNSVYFHTSNSLLEAMQENLRESSVRPKTSMKIPMTTDDISQLMESGVLTNDNPLGLFRKVWFDLTLHLGCGGQAALRGLTKDSFVMETDERGRRYIRLNHNVQGQRDRSCMEMQYWNWEGRMYELPGDPNCPVHSMELYLARRNPHKDAFFQRPKTHYNSGSLWYESPVGHGVLASLMSKMSEDSCLSRAYTNSSVRVTLADILEDKGLNVENILGINPKNKSVKSMMNRSSNHSSDELERNSKLIHEALYGPVTC